jgi:hypothetical protein
VIQRKGISRTRGSPENAKRPAGVRSSTGRPSATASSRSLVNPSLCKKATAMTVPGFSVRLTSTPRSIAVIPRTAEVAA